MKTPEALSLKISSAVWRPAADIARDFVRHRHPDASPGFIGSIFLPGAAGAASVIIPTSDAQRGGYFERLLGQLEAQTLEGIEIVIVRGDPRQGRAINIGAAIARGKYLITLDDDTDLPDAQALAKLVRAMEQHDDIGIAGANAVVPPHASRFMKAAMWQIPRRAWKPVEQITDSDLAQHPCMIMRAADFKKIGGENELLPRGLDPYLRREMRAAGKRVVCVPGVTYHHLLPATLPGLIRQFYRNGRQSAWVTRHYPHWVIETPPEHGEFIAHKSIAVRALRFPLRLLGALAHGHWIWLVCESAYGAGFIGGQCEGDGEKQRISK